MPRLFRNVRYLFLHVDEIDSFTDSFMTSCIMALIYSIFFYVHASVSVSPTLMINNRGMNETRIARMY